MNGLKTSWLGLILLCLCASSHATSTFPNLTGRVVDQANMLAGATEKRIAARLKRHEKKTTNQLVVATVNTLGGKSIERYALELGRHWQIGQSLKNNGVLLLIAKKERKVRIEVGYGLEGSLPDAVAASIIRNDISPFFKKGDFNAGTEVGVSSILKALDGSYVPESNPTSGGGLDNESMTLILIILFIIIWTFASPMIPGRRSRYRRRHRSGRSSSWSGGGGFSGGGGSFGGGGASGGW